MQQPRSTLNIALWTVQVQSGFRPDQEAAYKAAKYGRQKFIGGLERVVAGLQ
jgi:hypothetical protein